MIVGWNGLVNKISINEFIWASFGVKGFTAFNQILRNIDRGAI